jgi:3-dehydrotetronate 4-kinase
MKIGVIADDFTGASDIANTLHKAGARTIQFAGIPAEPISVACDAAVISLKSRSIPASEAVAQSLEACRALLASGAVQIVFKYCSTFDSTPAGNIGPVAEALLVELDAPMALVCPAFPANGRTVYQGHLFVGDRLLSQSGMEHHPLNPMTDPDLRRWLGRQTMLSVGHLPLGLLHGPDPAAALKAAATTARLIVADAVTDADLLALALLARDHRLVTGASGVAMGLPANFGITPNTNSPQFAGNSRPALILSGSCSRATNGQIAAYQTHAPSLRVDDVVLTDPDNALARAIAFVKANRHAAPLVYSTADAADVATLQLRHGAAALTVAFEHFFASLAQSAVTAGFGRLIVAGGETSGAVASNLGSGAFEIGPEIAPGVPALRTLGAPDLVLALKSGNFGDVDFFDRAVAVLGTRQ